MGDQLELFPTKTEEEKAEAENQIIEEQHIADYQIREYPVDVIVDKYIKGRENGENEIFIPDYQRKFVWNEEKQSKFIESIMLDLPIPYIFAADIGDNNGRVEIVDGSQRIRTLHAFINNYLVLDGLKKLTALNGFRHKDLIKSRQRRFNRKTLRIIELTDKSNIEVRKDIFERINTSPTLLKDMEVRKGVYEGDFYKFIEGCAQNQKFKMLCPISKERRDRAEGAEMVLRYFAYSERYLKFDHIVKKFLDQYIEDKSKSFSGEEAVRLATMFEDTLDFAQKYLPNGFRKTENARTTPRVRFEALSVGINLALEQNPNLAPKNVTGWINSDEFMVHTKSDGANSRRKVRERIEFVRDKLLSTTSHD